MSPALFFSWAGDLAFPRFLPWALKPSRPHPRKNYRPSITNSTIFGVYRRGPNSKQFLRITWSLSPRISEQRPFVLTGESNCLIYDRCRRIPDGTFKFSGFAAGRYSIVVTFPSIIQGRKIAWQVPVAAVAGKTARVESTDANFILPTYCRD